MFVASTLYDTVPLDASLRGRAKKTSGVGASPCAMLMVVLVPSPLLFMTPPTSNPPPPPPPDTSITHVVPLFT